MKETLSPSPRKKLNDFKNTSFRSKKSEVLKDLIDLIFFLYGNEYKEGLTHHEFRSFINDTRKSLFYLDKVDNSTFKKISDTLDSAQGKESKYIITKENVKKHIPEIFRLIKEINEKTMLGIIRQFKKLDTQQKNSLDKLQLLELLQKIIKKTDSLNHIQLQKWHIDYVLDKIDYVNETFEQKDVIRNYISLINAIVESTKIDMSIPCNKKSIENYYDENTFKNMLSQIEEFKNNPEKLNSSDIKLADIKNQIFKKIYVCCNVSLETTPNDIVVNNNENISNHINDLNILSKKNNHRGTLPITNLLSKVVEISEIAETPSENLTVSQKTIDIPSKEIKMLKNKEFLANSIPEVGIIDKELNDLQASLPDLSNEKKAKPSLVNKPRKSLQTTKSIIIKKFKCDVRDYVDLKFKKLQTQDAIHEELSESENSVELQKKELMDKIFFETPENLLTTSSKIIVSNTSMATPTGHESDLTNYNVINHSTVSDRKISENTPLEFKKIKSSFFDTKNRYGDNKDAEVQIICPISKDMLTSVLSHGGELEADLSTDKNISSATIKNSSNNDFKMDYTKLSELKSQNSIQCSDLNVFADKNLQNNASALSNIKTCENDSIIIKKNKDNFSTASVSNRNLSEINITSDNLESIRKKYLKQSSHAETRTHNGYKKANYSIKNANTKENLFQSHHKISLNQDTFEKKESFIQNLDPYLEKIENNKISFFETMTTDFLEKTAVYAFDMHKEYQIVLEKLNKLQKEMRSYMRLKIGSNQKNTQQDFKIFKPNPDFNLYLNNDTIMNLYKKITPLNNNTREYKLKKIELELKKHEEGNPRLLSVSTPIKRNLNSAYSFSHSRQNIDKSNLRIKKGYSVASNEYREKSAGIRYAAVTKFTESNDDYLKIDSKINRRKSEIRKKMYAFK